MKFFTAATSLFGQAWVPMKSDELVTDYVLCLRQPVFEVGLKNICDVLQALLFVMNLSTELKKGCGTQVNGKVNLGIV